MSQFYYVLDNVSSVWGTFQCADEYTVYKDEMVLATVENDHVYTDQNVDFGTPHSYRVLAKNGDNESSFSPEYLTEAVIDLGFVYVDTYVCDSWNYGTPTYDYWDLQPVNVHDDFEIGGTVQFLVKLNDIEVDHQFRMMLYRDGNLVREQIDPLNQPDPSWDYSSFTPYQEDLLPGSYEAIFYLDIGDGFQILSSKTFTVTGEDYTYVGSLVCEDWEYGTPTHDYWDLQPVNPKTEFEAGETVQLLSKIFDIYIDHEWKVEVWKNGVYQWESTSGWMDVDNIYGWEYSSFTPYITNATAGNYEFKVYLNDGSEDILLDIKSFTVTAGSGNIPYSQSFESGSDGFQLEDHLSTATLGLDATGGYNGSQCLKLTNTQTVSNWQVQVKKMALEFTQSTSYQGQIRIKGSTTGTIYIAVERAVDPWDNMGLWKEINVTTSWQTIDLDFTATGNPQLDTENVKFTIQAGGFVGDVFIDDVSFE